MGFNISPGVYTTETDLTTVIPSVATTTGAFAGVFRWGPVGQRVLLDTEKTLVRGFGKPTDWNAETFFTAANFLGYSSGMYLVRAANTSGTANNVANTTLTAVGMLVGSPSNTQLLSSTITNQDAFIDADFDPNVYYIAKYPGAIGNSLLVSVVETATDYSSNVSLTPNTQLSSTETQALFSIGSNTVNVTIVPSGTGTGATTQAVAETLIDSVNVGDWIKAGNNLIGIQYVQVASVGAAVTNGANTSVQINLVSPYNLASTYNTSTLTRFWQFYNKVNSAPGQSTYQSQNGNTAVQDELHVVVTDQDGLFTGVPGTILEVWEALSRSTDAKDDTGSSIYYQNVINTQSNYIYVTNDLPTGASATSANVLNATSTEPAVFSLVGGQDGLGEDEIDLATLANAYNLYASADEVDISIILQGTAPAGAGAGGSALANWLISNIVTVRMDCVACISPPYSAVVGVPGYELDNVIEFRQSLPDTSYAIMDSGYKYTYDKYNDVYRYVPLNGDIGGIISRNDSIAYPWFSPAGFNRGQVKNVYKLAWNPKQTDRDQLYQNDINPVVSIAGQGPVLYGDKTMLGTTSAFSRINVRRLFIVLEKAIAKASASLLFEINDAFTQAQFRNMVDPYLRQIQGNRGIYDYQIVCDDTNNTPQVVDSNGFAGDIYIKPARSINTIQLNFVAVSTGVDFSEIVGQS
jgi:hypothetical protein